MRLELTAPLDLNLTAEGEARRVVGGLAVPWGVTARLANGRRARFLPGSIDPTPTRAPLLCRNHDRMHPFGVVFEASDNGDGIYARARVSAIPEGDQALTLAADGVLRGLSVGVEALDWTEEGDDDPVIVVTAGRWDELSLVPWAAFDSAAVDYVAASAPEPDEPEPEPEPDDEPPPEEEPDVPDVLDAAAPTPALGIGRPTLQPTTGTEHLTLQGVGRDLVRAVTAAGGPAHATQAIVPVLNRLNAALNLEAVLTSVTTPSGTSGVFGLIRPQWENELVGLIDIGAPVVNAFQQGNLTSNPVTYPKWVTLPLVDIQGTTGLPADQKTAIVSGPVRIDPATVNAVTYAGGNDIAVQVIDWSSPSFIAEYLQACAQVYARKIDAAMTANILGQATGLATAGNLVTDIGAAIGLVAATGLMPDLIIAGATVFGRIWAANIGNFGGAMGMALNVDLPRPRVVLAPLATPTTLIVASSQAAKSWQNQGAPVQLRAVDVSLLGIDLGVYGYFANAVLYPTAIVKVTGITALEAEVTPAPEEEPAA